MNLFDFLIELIKSKREKKNTPVVVNVTTKNNNNNENNNLNNKPSAPSKSDRSRDNRTLSTRNSSNLVYLKAIKLYCTSVNGRTYTTTFLKSMNRDFGVEVVIKNNTSQVQTVKLGPVIYDKSGNDMSLVRTCYIKVNPNSISQKDIKVDSKLFFKMKNGKYKFQFWLNDKKIKKIFFTVKEK